MLLETAVAYLDTQDQALVYLIDAPDGLGKIVVRVNYSAKLRDGEKRTRLTSNFIRTGGIVKAEDVENSPRYLKILEDVSEAAPDSNRIIAA